MAATLPDLSPFLDCQSDVYKAVTDTTAAYVQARLGEPKCRMFDKYNTRILADSVDALVDAEGDALRNVVHEFFKLRQSACQCCHRTDVALQRCHPPGFSRKDLARRAAASLYADPATPVDKRSFLIAFVREHQHHPLFFLCRRCHVALDAL